MVHSFALVNGYDARAERQNNLWFTPEYPGVSYPMIAANYVEISDLPTVNSVIDFEAVRTKLTEIGYKQDFFMICSALQKKFALCLGCLVTQQTFPTYLKDTVKSMLALQCQHFTDVHKWELVLKAPLPFDYLQKAFKSMLKQCKISKFHEVNFKILH